MSCKKDTAAQEPQRPIQLFTRPTRFLQEKGYKGDAQQLRNILDCSRNIDKLHAQLEEYFFTGDIETLHTLFRKFPEIIPRHVMSESIDKWNRALRASDMNEGMSWWYQEGRLECSFCAYFMKCPLCPLRVHRTPNPDQVCKYRCMDEWHALADAISKQKDVAFSDLLRSSAMSVLEQLAWMENGKIPTQNQCNNEESI